jgi:Vacuolar protein sorting-associated protein 62
VRGRLALFVLVALALVPSAGGAGSARPPYAVLLARHVPILVLHPAEQFAPVRVDGFLADSDLQQRTAAGWETIPGPLPAGGADLRLDQRTCFAIEGPAASGCYAGAEAAHVSGPVVYGKVLRSRTRIDLQYWIWYPFNDYSASFPPSEAWQVHEGDWESVSVILDLEGRPLLVGLSKHCEGTRRDWSDARRRGARPIAYVALGSHANYFEPGTFRHSPVCWPRALRDVVRALRLRDRTGSGRVVRPLLVPVTSTQPSWMQFAGKWGESGYVHFPNNPPIAYDGAPRAPAFQETWRRPVSEELSWPPG